MNRYLYIIKNVNKTYYFTENDYLCIILITNVIVSCISCLRNIIACGVFCNFRVNSHALH